MSKGSGVSGTVFFDVRRRKKVKVPMKAEKARMVEGRGGILAGEVYGAPGMGGGDNMGVSVNGPDVEILARW